jgi:hypothetical protein
MEPDGSVFTVFIIPGRTEDSAPADAAGVPGDLLDFFLFARRPAS